MSSAAVTAAMEARKSNNYKQLKEAFVSNLSGGTIWEINAVTLVLPSAVLLWSVLQSRRHFFTSYTTTAALADFLINCVAILGAITVYSNQPLLLNALLISPAVFAFLSPKQDGVRRKAPAKPPQSHQKSPTASGPELLPLKPFVSMYRGHMMIITCAAILAVDFRIFPRRFAKVENWGTSLMDLGVGSFVFSGGVISARTILKAQLTGQQPNLVARLKDAVRHSLPLLVLGLIRLYSVKGVDYAEHVTEYGVHWNFFFTLGCLPPFLAICHSAFSLIPSYAILALIIGVGYQLALEFTNLKSFIFTAPRDNLFSQNREGIFSFFGYLAIFLSGHATGMYVLPRASKPTATAQSSSKARLARSLNSTSGRLATWAFIWTTLLSISMSYQGFNIQVSRRLANLPYFLWVAAFNCFHLMLCSTIETVCFPDIYNADDITEERRRCLAATSRLLHAFNRNGLALFLLANLLTGAVNLTMPTLHMKSLESMAVLLAYVAILSGTALVLDAKNISIKL